MLNASTIEFSRPAPHFPSATRAAAGVGDLVFARLPVPTLVLAMSTAVLDSNEAAERLLSQGSTLRVGYDGRVWYRANGRWLSLIGLASRMAVNTRLTTTVDLPGGRWGPMTIERLVGDGDDLLTLVVAEGGTGDADALRARFGLTPREVDVARLCRQGKAPAAIAEELRIALSTVRTHVLQLFSKTGTQRQSELVAALAGWPATAG